MKLGEEIDNICSYCKVGKNTDRCMRILRGLEEQECLLQKVQALKLQQGLQGNALEAAIAAGMQKAGYAYTWEQKMEDEKK